MLFAIFFALAISHLPGSQRVRLETLISGLRQALFLMVQWILRLTPAAAFLLALSFSHQRGFAAGSLLLRYVVLISGVLLALTVLLYPVAVLAGRIKLRDFSRSLLAGQIVAVSTRSSLASVPALLRIARTLPELPQEMMAFSIPFAASTFKLNRTISGMVKFLFLAHLYGIDPSTSQIGAFVLLNLLTSVGSPGLPGGSASLRLLPAYTAAGIPVEGIVLIEAVAAIPDVFETLLNTTGYMTAAVVLSRHTPFQLRSQPHSQRTD